jgi:hypothetical protein
LIGGSYAYSLPASYFPNYAKHDQIDGEKAEPRTYKFSFKLDLIAHPNQKITYVSKPDEALSTTKD